MLGKYPAIATPILALAAAMARSEDAIVGLRSSKTEGTPGGGAGKGRIQRRQRDGEITRRLAG